MTLDEQIKFIENRIAILEDIKYNQFNRNWKTNYEEILQSLRELKEIRREK